MVLRQMPFLFYLLFLGAVQALRNVTIDDNDDSITYSPSSSWNETDFDELNIGGRHMVTSDTSATATFTFTGIAIYFYSPLWPFRVSTALSLDGEPAQTVDLTDYTVPTVDDGPETVQSQVVWSLVGLENTEHTLVISVGAGEDIAIVDALMYTALDPGDSTSSISKAPSSTSYLPLPTHSSTSAVASTSSSAKKGLSIALGLVCTTFGLLVLGALYWYWRRRQRKREEEELYNEHDDSPEMSNTTQGTYASRGPRTGYYSRPRDPSSRYRPVNNTAPRRVGSSSSIPSASSPLRHSTTISAPSAAVGKVKPKRSKPLTTIPEVVVAREDGWRPTSTTGPNHPDGADRDDTSPRISQATPPWTEIGMSRAGGKATSTP
ncbi:hypothetical protein M413DRAFT_447638 [Hebeloma cylindrosporum]|uniref:Mid2 domain-containing protein n=1 Tax=Hebeloma cylindrosporum TaxID=76867 RepID=A0A0C3C525_HEBCY|nr:hypothetical protein M413DRAFT_447638 [Hebeloma cylindrosporum h7]